LRGLVGGISRQGNREDVTPSGTKPIPVPAGVKIALQSGKIDVARTEGEVVLRDPRKASRFEQERRRADRPPRKPKSTAPLHGPGARAWVANRPVHGVTSGFKKELDIVGVGYSRPKLKGQDGFPSRPRQGLTRFNFSDFRKAFKSAVEKARRISS